VIAKILRWSARILLGLLLLIVVAIAAFRLAAMAALAAPPRNNPKLRKLLARKPAWEK
jgi:uncharacterized protein (DUF1778 family)